VSLMQKKAERRAKKRFEHTTCIVILPAHLQSSV
jgi:hypothetical protein